MKEVVENEQCKDTDTWHMFCFSSVPRACQALSQFRNFEFTISLAPSCPWLTFSEGGLFPNDQSQRGIHSILSNPLRFCMLPSWHLNVNLSVEEILTY